MLQRFCQWVLCCFGGHVWRPRSRRHRDGQGRFYYTHHRDCEACGTTEMLWADEWCSLGL
jgi:hypothetical protein